MKSLGIDEGRPWESHEPRPPRHWISVWRRIEKVSKDTHPVLTLGLLARFFFTLPVRFWETWWVLLASDRSGELLRSLWLLELPLCGLWLLAISELLLDSGERSIAGRNSSSLRGSGQDAVVELLFGNALSLMLASNSFEGAIWMGTGSARNTPAGLRFRTAMTLI